MHGHTRILLAIGLALATGGCGRGRRGAPPPSEDWALLGGGALVTARAGHGATALADGRVLITGGAGSGEAALRSAERYDPQAGWSEPLVGALGQARAWHQSLRLPDGRVWLVGGYDADGRPLGSTELYDPASGTFAPGPDLGAPRADAALGVVGDRVVLAGGADAASVEVWTLDPLARYPEWGFALPHPVLGGALVVVDPAAGALALVGGRQADGGDAAPVWLDLAARQAAAQEGGEWLHGGAGVRHGERAWVLGGVLETSGAFTREGQRLTVPPRLQAGEVGAYPALFQGDPERVELREARRGATAVSAPDGVYVLGGERQGYPSPVIERVEAGLTVVGQPLQVARRDLRATVLPDGVVVVTGGVDAQGRDVALVEQLVPAAALGPDSALVFARREAELAELDRLRGVLAETLDLLAAERALTDDLRAQLAAALDLVRQREARIAALEGQVAALQTQLQQSQQQANALRAQLAAVNAELSQARTRLTQQQAELERLRQALVAAEAEVSRLRQVEADLRAQLAAPPPIVGAPVSSGGLTTGGGRVLTLAPGPISGIVQGRPQVNVAGS